MLANATWEDIRPFYEELTRRRLDGGTVEAWLRDWSGLEELLREAQTEARIAYTADTGDRAREAAHLRFSSEIGPRMQEQQVRLSRRLVETGYARSGLETMIRRFRNQVELFREANVPLLAELQKLNARYQKITGAMTVERSGKDGSAASPISGQPGPRRSRASLSADIPAVHRAAGGACGSLR